MTNLCFQPVLRGDAAKDSAVHSTLQIDALKCEGRPIDLWTDAAGVLVATSHDSQPHSPAESLLATVVSRMAATHAEPHWWLIPRTNLLALNGVRMLPLAALEPGDFLTAGIHRWLVTVHWTPEPIAAPEAIASRECPVCGGCLSLSPVIRCPCGRYYHLEKPEAPDDANALNCYLTGRCNVCQREPSLEARYLPCAEEKLLM
jgi:hypothetical protein